MYQHLICLPTTMMQLKVGRNPTTIIQLKVCQNPTTIIQLKVGQNPNTMTQLKVGQNPTLNYMGRILTRTMDMLLGFCIAGQNPKRVKILSNRAHEFSVYIFPVCFLSLPTQHLSWLPHLLHIMLIVNLVLRTYLPTRVTNHPFSLFYPLEIHLYYHLHQTSKNCSSIPLTSSLLLSS